MMIKMIKLMILEAKSWFFVVRGIDWSMRVFVGEVEIVLVVNWSKKYFLWAEAATVAVMRMVVPRKISESDER